MKLNPLFILLCFMPLIGFGQFQIHANLLNTKSFQNENQYVNNVTELSRKSTMPIFELGISNRPRFWKNFRVIGTLGVSNVQTDFRGPAHSFIDTTGLGINSNTTYTNNLRYGFVVVGIGGELHFSKLPKGLSLHSMLRVHLNTSARTNLYESGGFFGFSSGFVPSQDLKVEVNNIVPIISPMINYKVNFLSIFKLDFALGFDVRPMKFVKNIPNKSIVNFMWSIGGRLQLDG